MEVEVKCPECGKPLVYLRDSGDGKGMIFENCSGCYSTVKGTTYVAK